MGRLIIVLLDGLSLGAARKSMSYMGALSNAGLAREFAVNSVLPPLSRPAYATLLTGLTPLEHGITRNEPGIELNAGNFFAKAGGKGLTTCAAAYHWFFELVEGQAFSGLKHRVWDDSDAGIQHGLFYSHDDYPDSELFYDAEALRLRWLPDLMLVHSMGIDWAGHQFGGDSEQYLGAARNADGLLAMLLPGWRQAGYEIVLTSDHGMDAAGSHYDNTAQCRRIPLWIISPDAGKYPEPDSFVDIHKLIVGILLGS